MKPYRALAYSTGCMALAAAALVYLEHIHQLGFPDGFITELERAQRGLARVFIGWSVAAGAGAMVLGAMASRRRIGKPLLALGIAYAVVLLAAWLVNRHFQTTLMGGGGG